MPQDNNQTKEEPNKRVVAPIQKEEDRMFDLTLRPKSLSEFIGQKKIKENLRIFIEAAKRRKESLEHVLFHGSPGIGKCISKDSIVFTEKGMAPIEELGDLNQKGFQKKQINLYSNGKSQTASHFYNNGKGRTVKIRTQQGFELEGTPNHPIVTLTPKGLAFKQLQGFQVGDYVAIERRQNYFGKNIDLPSLTFPSMKAGHYYNKIVLPHTMTCGLARICGYLIGDGYIGKTGEITFTNNNLEILKDFQDLWKSLFGQTKKVSEWRNKCPVIRIKNMKIREFFKKIGLPYSTAGTKCIPWSIMCAPKKIVREFLRAYFECDGHIRPNCRQMDVASASRKLIEQIQIILLNFGIISRRYSKWNKVEKKTYWRLYITGGDVDIFNKEIGFISKEKTQAHKNLNLQKNTNKDLVPYGKDKIQDIRKRLMKLTVLLQKKKYRRTFKQKISSEEMNHCLNNLTKILSDVILRTKEYRHVCSPHIFWDKIKDKKEGDAHTVDVTVPTTHTFFANGFINHNTTLAHIIARELRVNIKTISGPALEKAGDLCSILTNLEENDVLFIDEMHRMNRVLEEILYPAMEEYCLDIVIGQGPSARTLRLDLPKFTLVGATTRVGLLSSPLRNRFGNTFRIDFYGDEDIKKIVLRSAKILKINIEDQAAWEIAKRARKTPRVANRLLKRVRDYSQVKADGVITLDIVKKALDLLEIDELGLDEVDRKILRTIMDKFQGRPVGIQALSAATSEERDTLEEVYEPYLLQIGFIARTPRGRIATKAAYEHLGLRYPKKLQEELKF